MHATRAAWRCRKFAPRRDLVLGHWGDVAERALFSSARTCPPPSSSTAVFTVLGTVGGVNGSRRAAAGPYVYTEAGRGPDSPARPPERGD